MGKIFTLDSYKEKADETYGSFVIKIDDETSTVLSNPLRIDDEKRARVFEIVDELSENDTPEGEEGKWQEVGADDNLSVEDLNKLQPLLTEFLSLVGDDKTAILLDAIRGDLAVLMSIFQDYFEAVGLGEASTSPESSTSGARKRSRTSGSTTKSA